MADGLPVTPDQHDSGSLLPNPDRDPLGLESLWRLVERPCDALVGDPLLGTTIGDVLLVRLINEGGMGRVYEGRQVLPRRSVAVKVLRPGLFTRDSIRRFLKETQILGRLRHAGISQVFSAGTFEIAGGQLPYFVMELIPDALTITEYVRSLALPIRDRLDLFCRVCDAVAHAHLHGIVHRDLKPTNILVDHAGNPRVIDFGIARDGSGVNEATTLTGSGQMLGTIQYMSPEQVDGTATIDARSDVYSLGVILHELVTGRKPYEISRKPLLEAVRIIRNCGPSAVAVSDPEAPLGITLVIDRCLQKDAGRRYADAATVAADVRNYVGANGVGKRLKVRMRLALKRLRRRWQATLIAAVALAVATVIATTATMRSSEPVEKPAVVATRVSPKDDSATVAFRFAFGSVLDRDADRFLVESSGMRKWNDPREEPRVNYWGPSQDGVEGRLVYRVKFPGRTARIRLDTESQCWDFVKHPGGFGRGVSAIEASCDGVAWISLRDNIKHCNWGASWELHETLPSNLAGNDELWLRLRFLTEKARLELGYTVAQFARAVEERPGTVFLIEADCVAAE